LPAGVGICLDLAGACGVLPFLIAKPRMVPALTDNKENHMSKNTTTPPSHRVYAVSKNGKGNFWQPIGAMRLRADGEGFNLKLDYLPLNGMEIVVRKPRQTDLLSKRFAECATVTWVNGACGYAWPPH